MPSSHSSVRRAARGVKGRSPLDAAAFMSAAIAAEVGLREALFETPSASAFNDTISDMGDLAACGAAFEQVIAADRVYGPVLRQIKEVYDQTIHSDAAKRAASLQEQLWQAEKTIEALKQEGKVLEARRAAQALEAVTLRRRLAASEEQLLAFVDANKGTIAEASVHAIRWMNAKLAKQVASMEESLDTEQPLLGKVLSEAVDGGEELRQALAQCQQTIGRLARRVEVLIRELEKFATTPWRQRLRGAVRAVICMRDMQRLVEGVAQGLDVDSGSDVSDLDRGESFDANPEQPQSRPAAFSLAALRALQQAPSVVRVDAATQTGAEGSIRSTTPVLTTTPADMFTPAVPRTRVVRRRRPCSPAQPVSCLSFSDIPSSPRPRPITFVRTETITTSLSPHTPSTLEVPETGDSADTVVRRRSPTSGFGSSPGRRASLTHSPIDRSVHFELPGSMSPRPSPREISHPAAPAPTLLRFLKHPDRRTSVDLG